MNILYLVQLTLFLKKTCKYDYIIVLPSRYVKPIFNLYHASFDQ